jgi:hypothetical protein
MKWPMNGWPKDPSYKMLGKITYVNVVAGLEAFSYRPLVSHRWSPSPWLKQRPASPKS